MNATVVNGKKINKSNKKALNKYLSHLLIEFQVEVTPAAWQFILARVNSA